MPSYCCGQRGTTGTTRSRNLLWRPGFLWVIFSLNGACLQRRSDVASFSLRTRAPCSPSSRALSLVVNAKAKTCRRGAVNRLCGRPPTLLPINHRVVSTLVLTAIAAAEAIGETDKRARGGGGEEDLEHESSWWECLEQAEQAFSHTVSQDLHNSHPTHKSPRRTVDRDRLVLL